MVTPNSLGAQGGIYWEAISCPLCGSNHEQEFLALPGENSSETYRLVLCQDCGMGYLNPRPDVKSIGRFYPDDYEPYQADGKGRVSWWTRLQQRLSGLVLSHRYGYPPPLTRWSQKLLAVLAGPWFAPDPNSLTAVP